MSKKDIRCPFCNKKFFVVVGEAHGVIEIKCERCKVVHTVTLTHEEHNGKIDSIRVS